MTVKIEEASAVQIYMAGALLVAEQVCREFCFEVGACVTVTKTNYIYTGGEESGFIVGLVNYPLYPATPAELLLRGEKLGDRLMVKCFQKSYLIQTPTVAQWRSRRDEVQQR